MVSGRYLAPNAPLLCWKSMPAAAVTSASRKPRPAGAAAAAAAPAERQQERAARHAMLTSPSRMAYTTSSAVLWIPRACMILARCTAHRVGAHPQHGGDLLVGFPVDDQLQHLQLPRGQGPARFLRRGGHRTQPRVQHALPGCHLLDRLHQFQVHGVLQQVAVRARLQAGADVGRLGVHAQNQNGRLRAGFQDVARGHRAVHAGQREVHHHHRRMQRGCGCHRFVAVAGLRRPRGFRGHPPAGDGTRAAPGCDRPPEAP